MGCPHSLPDTHPRIFKAKNLNDDDRSVNSVLLEVQSNKVMVHSRNHKLMASWPIACIKRYGCNKQGILFIEAGNGCDTGQGLYLFKCTRNEQVFDLLKRYWEELQNEHSNPIIQHQQMQIMSAPTRTVITSSSHNQQYYNTNGSNHWISDQASSSSYTNDCVRLPSASSSTNHIPPVSATSRGSTSSQHGSALASLPEGTPLRLDSANRPFALQPAPTSRKEMMIRRRFNSDLPVGYNKTTDRITVGPHQRRNSESTNYENSDVIRTSSGSFPRSHRVSYRKNAQQVNINTSTNLSQTPSESIAESSAPYHLSPDVMSVSRDMSMTSLRSDFEPLLTPGSKSSGIGSLSGNGGSLSSNPPQIPLSLSDPWVRPPVKNRRGMSPSLVPHSACEYVNTVNASMDVLGTPLPATAVGTVHFNFDFDHSSFPRVSRPGFALQSKLNYVPVEILKNGDIDYSCGASSASSGIPGTPKTPKTPLSNHQATDYAVIDHKKTRALSDIHRARQRELKPSRHTNGETSTASEV